MSGIIKDGKEHKIQRLFKVTKGQNEGEGTEQTDTNDFHCKCTLEIIL